MDTKRTLQPGLSLLEVMLAVLIVGISVISILSLQGKLSRGVYTAHAVIDRLPFIKSFFAEASREGFYKRESGEKRVLDNPSLTLDYAVGKPSSKTLKQYQNIVIEQVKAEWPLFLGKRNETFGLVRFLPKASKKEASKGAP